MNKLEPQKLQGEILYALAEFKVLTTPAYCNSTKLFKEYFRKAEHQNAFRSPEYIRELSYIIQSSKLKEKAYYEVVFYYHLTEKERDKIIPEAQLLYDALAEKVDINASTKSKLNLLPFFALPFIIYIFQKFFYGNKIYTPYIILFLCACCCFWIYDKLYIRFSHKVAQIFTLLFVNIVLFFTYALDVWAPIIHNSDTMLNIVVYSFLLSGVWIIGLIVFSIIQKIIRSIKK